MNNVTAIIPCYKNPKYLDICLRSAVEGRVDKNNKILVVLDGFIEMFSSLIEKYRNEVDFYGFPENRGMQTALNYGVFKTTTDYIFILNDDNVFGKNWDIELTKHCSENLIVTANQIEPPTGGYSMFNFVVKDFGRDAESFQYDAFIAYERTISETRRTPTGSIFPFMMSKRLYLAVGGFDTYYDSPNVCDWDFFLKCQLQKAEFTRVYNLHLYHFGSVVTKKGEEAEKFRMREQNASRAHVEKWGWPPMNEPIYNIKFPLNIPSVNGITFPTPVHSWEILSFK